MIFIVELFVGRRLQRREWREVEAQDKRDAMAQVNKTFKKTDSFHIVKVTVKK